MATSTALVTINVSATVEANDDTATTPANTPVAIDVLANDLVNGVPATAAALDGEPIVTVPPANGTVVWNEGAGQFDYTPNEGFCGTDTFEYEIERECEFAPPPDCASFNIEFDDGGWGPRNFLPPSSMSNLPSGFVPGATEPQIVVTVGSTPVVFDWFEAQGQYINNDYASAPNGANWPATTFQWGSDPGTVSCVDVAFLPRV